MGSNYRAEGSVIEAIVLIVLLALRLFASIAIPGVKLIALGLLAFQDFVLGEVLARFLSASGVELDIESMPVRLAAAVILYGSLLVAAYLLFLAGSHLATLVILALAGAGLGLAMTLITAARGTGSTDLLSSLRFWEE